MKFVVKLRTTPDQTSEGFEIDADDLQVIEGVVVLRKGGDNIAAVPIPVLVSVTPKQGLKL